MKLGKNIYIGNLKTKKTLKKINSILKDIDRNGYNCAGHLEALKGNLSGYYSIHIDKKNRIVFRINNVNGQDEVEVLQCGSHYKDKWFYKKGF